MSLYFCLIHSRLQYAIEAWGIQIVYINCKGYTEVINNKKIRHHTDPLFKRNNILNVSDLYKLQVFSFMHDLVNNKRPGSFDEFILMTKKSMILLQDRVTDYT